MEAASVILVTQTHCFDAVIKKSKILTRLFLQLDSRWRRSLLEDDSSLLLQLAQLKREEGKVLKIAEMKVDLGNARQ